MLCSAGLYSRGSEWASKALGVYRLRCVSGLVMASHSPSSRFLTVRAALAASALSLVTWFATSVSSATPAAAQGATARALPSRVEADYRITFNGFDIGGFAFKATLDRRGYLLTGDTDISALLGAVRWVGATRVVGRFVGAAPKPTAFTFNFEGTGATGAIRVAFDRGRVVNASTVPPRPARATTVPLLPQHTENVLDPLSALLVMARPRSGAPCKQQLAIFDGQQRFDLVLSPKSVSGRQHVCAIKYVPIGGYDRNAQTMAMAAGTGLEITLREVAGAGLFVPVRIRIPTGAGPVELVSSRLDVAPPVQHVAVGN
jgi:hypothetical protein